MIGLSIYILKKKKTRKLFKNQFSPYVLIEPVSSRSMNLRGMVKLELELYLLLLVFRTSVLIILNPLNTTIFSE